MISTTSELIINAKAEGFREGKEAAAQALGNLPATAGPVEILAAIMRLADPAQKEQGTP